MSYDVPGPFPEWLARHLEREAAAIAEQLVDGEPGSWWFQVEREGGAVWDRLCPAFHAVASWNLHLVEPRFARGGR